MAGTCIKWREKIYKNLKFLCVALILVYGNCSAGTPELFEYMESQLVHSGVLKSNGEWVYVDLDDSYIYDLIAFIESSGFETPPYFGDEGRVGAHISVVFPDELNGQEIEECGEIIAFLPKECQVVRYLKTVKERPAGFERVENICLISVEAPRLDEIRGKYGLSPKRYEFHITIGIKPELNAI